MSPVLALLVTAILVPQFEGRHADTAGLIAHKPSVVLILTDDQRHDTVWAMENVQRMLVDHGVAFTNAFAVNALCCPSRASILTGQYSHSTLVYANSGPYGGFDAFDDSLTMATVLDQAGYETGIFGKYLNEYSGSYLPPGWDHVSLFTNGSNAGGAYYDYTLNIDGELASYGGAPEDYSTDVLAAQAVSFVYNADGPLFLFFTPFGPHLPAIPASRHMGAFGDLERHRPPSYNEGDVSDKPAWVQAVPPMSEQKQSNIDRIRANQYRTLLSVDEALASIVTALFDTGRLSNAMIVFASDNGGHWGEHRLTGKGTPYEESIRVPLVIRYDPKIQSPHKSGRLATNIDFAPTILEAAGTSLPGVEGQSLVPLLEAGSVRWRTDFLVEHLRADAEDVPTHCMVRTNAHAYIRYQTDEEELYDLAQDPYQLLNVADDPSHASLLRSMRRRLVRLCDPPPPGFAP